MNVQGSASSEAMVAECLIARAEMTWRDAYRDFPCCRAGDDFEHTYWPRIQVIYALFLRWPLLTADTALALYLDSAAVAESDKIAIQHRVLFGRVWAQLLRETRNRSLRPV
ncbi:hypothetical protein SAMN05428989_0669 [Pseudoxanthomonas sp. GM95]|uniref:hypothetical protein n=1 Tax=Pseudoxanthomonas sp. GM95 TaxID=1881043 RepID=UPI0008AB8B50|nr:hypothetical protein [Pseudoxanthomonas sp. GM95]SEK72342.1 hypothetical protein SAMN05428989_0669 [Pseudoxanthomonas sp. GM95]